MITDLEKIREFFKNPEEEILILSRSIIIHWMMNRQEELNIRKLKLAYPRKKMLALVPSDCENIEKILAGGADGVLLIPCREIDVIKAVQTMTAYGTYLDKTFTQAFINEFLNQKKAERRRMVKDNEKFELVQNISNLYFTEKEAAIFIKLVEGKKRKQISEETYLSENTVRNYTVKILKKIGASKRMNVLQKGIEKGIIRSKDQLSLD